MLSVVFDNHKLRQSPGGQTNQPMDGKNNRRTDGKTFKPYREARTHQREGNVIPSRNSFDQSIEGNFRGSGALFEIQKH